MERCRGTTKAGARCKRAAQADSQYCSTHAAQAGRAGKTKATPGAEKKLRADKKPRAERKPRAESTPRAKGSDRASAEDPSGRQRREDVEYDDIDRIWGLATMALIVGAVLLLKGGSRLW